MKKNNFKIFISVAICMVFILSLWVYFLKLNFREIDKKANQEKDFFWRDFLSFDIKLEEKQEIKDSFDQLNEILHSTSTTTTLDIMEQNMHKGETVDAPAEGEVLGARDERVVTLSEDFQAELLKRVQETLDQKSPEK